MSDVKTAIAQSESPSETADTVRGASQLPDSLIPTIRIDLHFSRVPELTIQIEWNHPPRIPNPSPYEMDRCPPSFRCYACLQTKGKKRHFGGEVLEKRICRECYPFVDESDVAAWMRFDKWHGFSVGD